ncbi:MmcQ/YjbR family DNA-binding protein [Cytobacillus firmus]|uniref:MmcQ/YjbR family DNA-binding protein n=1 Tax=Cytobacillus firmus TaxID=1399 RepID=UPI001C8D3179|nr:MmcQ/YjbR family DNA-binding protein [Cytobacillus firmus]MBX9975828.1 MmcQ/YjbR family DNA-binding protein [Cytobacillus firmus]
MIHKQLKSQKSIETLTKVREIAIGFPATAEQVDKFGHTSFRVKDKPFVILGENEEGIPSIAMKTSKETQEFLVQEGSRFFKTPYIGQHGWTSILGDHEPEWVEVEGLIKEAYLRTAPKSILKSLKMDKSPS